jgi:acetyltransferase-like isoleucine patch superfamily enzyme
VAVCNPFDSGYVESAELRTLGFASIGTNVRIARACTIIGPENISLGDHVRIDPYSILVASGPGKLEIGSHVHVGGWGFLSANEGLVVGDFCGLSQGVRIYTRADDFSGDFLTNPTVPAAYTNVRGAAVCLQRHVIIGSGSVILPGVTIGEGSAVGALSLVKRDLEAWGIYFGSPARFLKPRSRGLLDMEAALLAEKAARSGAVEGPEHRA